MIRFGRTEGVGVDSGTDMRIVPRSAVVPKIPTGIDHRIERAVIERCAGEAVERIGQETGSRYGLAWTIDGGTAAEAARGPGKDRAEKPAAERVIRRAARKKAARPLSSPRERFLVFGGSGCSRRVAALARVNSPQDRGRLLFRVLVGLRHALNGADGPCRRVGYIGRADARPCTRRLVCDFCRRKRVVSRNGGCGA